MIGDKIYKPLEEDYIYTSTTTSGSSRVENPSPNTFSKYSKLAEWCNNNNATIEDKGDYYEVVTIPEPSGEELAFIVRSQRNAKLEATDYLLASDYSISAEDLEEVKTYRQALRDIPEQSGFPKNVVWPKEPKPLQIKSIASLGLAKVAL